MLRLEITESAYMDNPEQLIKVVDDLRDLGFCIEMDDFGSGYSSLNTLKDVPVDIDTCVEVTDLVSAKLDEIDPINQEYYLEISSPGLERPLKTFEAVQKSVAYLKEKHVPFEFRTTVVKHYHSKASFLLSHSFSITSLILPA